MRRAFGVAASAAAGVDATALNDSRLGTAGASVAAAVGAAFVDVAISSNSPCYIAGGHSGLSRSMARGVNGVANTRSRW